MLEPLVLRLCGPVECLVMFGTLRQKASSSQARDCMGRAGRQRSLILTAVNCSQGDTCDYKFSDGASSKRGSVE